MCKRAEIRDVGECVRFWDFVIPQANAASFDPRDLAGSRQARENGWCVAAVADPPLYPTPQDPPMSRASIVLALTVFALTTSVAQAQIPNLRRKAKDAARQAITGQQPQQHRPPPKFDNTVLELNPQVVARLITGLETRSKTRGTGSQTAADLRKRSSAASDEAASINNQHSDDRA